MKSLAIEQREHVISEIEYVLDPIKYGYPIPAMVKGVLHDCLNFLKSERGNEELIQKVVGGLDYVRKGGIAPEDATQLAVAMDWLQTLIR